MKLGLLCSGSLGLKLLKYLSKSQKILFVFTDNQSKDIQNYCISAEIPFFLGNPRKGKSKEFIEKYNFRDKPVDVVISVNYLFIIEEDIINLSSKLSFNVHGSLLPKYRGRTPHVWSIINNEKYTGVTAHLIDKGCDTGDIIEQVVIEIDNDDTGGSLLEKYSKVYIPLIDRVLKDVSEDKVELTRQNHTEACFFEKRAPSDGLIDWCWQKERIRNWVRAQADPYPGAFTYLLNERIIIDEIIYSSCGYEQGQTNGTILSVVPLVVKTPNGAVEITKTRNEINVKLKKGLVLGHENR